MLALDAHMHHYMPIYGLPLLNSPSFKQPKTPHGAHSDTTHRQRLQRHDQPKGLNPRLSTQRVRSDNHQDRDGHQPPKPLVTGQNSVPSFSCSHASLHAHIWPATLSITFPECRVCALDIDPRMYFKAATKHHPEDHMCLQGEPMCIHHSRPWQMCITSECTAMTSHTLVGCPRGLGICNVTVTSRRAPDSFGLTQYCTTNNRDWF